MRGSSIKQIINKVLSVLDLAVVNKSVHDQSIEKVASFETLIKNTELEKAPFYRLLSKLSPKERQAINPYILLSKSQLAQDLFVMSQSTVHGFPYFFVEFGATNGVQLSNTYLLEKYLGWQGILVEPARVWQVELKRNRNCMLDFSCISSCSGNLVDFLEAAEDPDDELASPELSSMVEFADSGDLHSKRRMYGSKIYKVPTLSLNDLLKNYSAPRDIGYLSIDTEGSELAILSDFDFSKHSFRVITVEHNYLDANRDAIHALLASNGYRRVLSDISLWDDWYIMD